MEKKRNILRKTDARQTRTDSPAIEPLKLIVCIINRGMAERVTELCLAQKIAMHLTLRGNGTADSKILDYLSLGDTEKDVVLVCVRASVAEGFFKELTAALRLDEPGRGIAFRIPLSSIAERGALELLSGFSAKEE